MCGRMGKLGIGNECKEWNHGGVKVEEKVGKGKHENKKRRGEEGKRSVK